MAPAIPWRMLIIAGGVVAAALVVWLIARGDG